MNSITDKEGLKKLILYIAQKSKEYEMSLTTIRLVKLIYLIDENIFEAEGKKYTDLDWVYLHYGPYSVEIANVIKEMENTLLNKNEWEDDDRKGVSYRPLEFIRIEKLPGSSEDHMYIDGVLKRWGDKGTDEILEYVYEDSPPMWGIKKGDKLKFENLIKLKEERILFKETYDKYLAVMKAEQKEWCEFKKKYKSIVIKHKKYNSPDYDLNLDYLED